MKNNTPILNNMQKIISQYEFENRIYKVLAHGDEIEIAARLQRSPGLVSQMFNPSDERESDLFKAYKTIISHADVDARRGRYLFRLFIQMCEQSMPADSAAADSIEEACTRFTKEMKEFFDAKFCGEPLEIQISELDDWIFEAMELKKAKQAALKTAIRRDSGFMESKTARVN